MRFKSQALNGCCPRGGMGLDVETRELYNTLNVGLLVSMYPVPGFNNAAYAFDASRFKFPSGLFPEWQPTLAQFVVSMVCISVEKETESITVEQPVGVISPLLYAHA